MFQKVLAAVGVGVAVLALMVVPTMAQSATPDTGSPQNTITVTGYGTVQGTPDIATVDVGVDVTKPTVTEGFTQANATVQKVITALTGLGIAASDIQTNNLSVYSTTISDPETGKNTPGYTVSNTVEVTVHDVSKVENVIDTAIGAGATSLYGLSFDIADRSKLETQARQLAMQDAQARAQEYAGLINAKLGDVQVIAENQTGGAVPVAFRQAASVGGGGAVVAPGQTAVQIQVSVTYAIER